MADALGGVDFTQYQSWKQVRTPSGGVYYAVPGTAYVYSPFHSTQKGKPVLFQNPQPQLDAEAAQQAEQDRVRKLQEKQASPMGQLLPVAGSVGGLALTNYLINNGSKSGEATALETLAEKLGLGKTATQGAGLTQPNIISGNVMPNSAQGGMPTAPTSGVTEKDLILPADSPPPPGYTKVGISKDGSQALNAPVAEVQSGQYDWSKIGQGAFGAFQAIQGVQQFKDDKIGGTLNTAAGVANIGAATGNQMLASAVPYLGPAAAAYGGYQTAKMIGSAPAGGKRNSQGAIGGASAGASLGTAILPGIGTAIGAGVGALAGLAGSVFGSSKDKYQMIRDKGRDFLKQNGVIDENYQGTLADGSKFDFGKDGKKYGKLNTEDPNWGQVAALANTLATGEGMYGRGREAMATLYTNAALSNAKGDLGKAVQNIQHFAQQRGFNGQSLQQQFDKMKEAGQISDSEHAVYSADIGKVVTPQAAAPGKAPVQQQRSNTRSPGIGKDGKRLSQEAMKAFMNGAKRG